MKWLKRKLQDWLGITNLANKVVDIDLRLQPKTESDDNPWIVRGYDKT